MQGMGTLALGSWRGYERSEVSGEARSALLIEGVLNPNLEQTGKVCVVAVKPKYPASITSVRQPYGHRSLC